MKITTKIDWRFQKENVPSEWLVTNGIGGFACGSVSCTPLRRYHCLLNAAFSEPYGRTIMLNFVQENVLIPGHSKTALTALRLMGETAASQIPLIEFRIENKVPIWTYDVEGVIIEKSVFLIHAQNTLNISYKLLSEREGISLEWRPFFQFRQNEEPVNIKREEVYTVHSKDFQYEIENPQFPPLRICSDSSMHLHLDYQEMDNVFYQLEAERGYEHIGGLKSPGLFITSLIPNKRVTFFVSTESWDTILAMSSNEAWEAERIRKKNLFSMAKETISQSPVAARLILAASQFIISPRTRFKDRIRLQATGEGIRTIIAGYPWFTDWGRDTMISLEGLTLVTGRFKEAHSILQTFAYYIQDGLIPNMFPDGETQGIYNTADATLWFFHAIDRYIAITEDQEILEFLLPKLQQIITHHMKGTKFGIKMDEDGLLKQGAEGYQLTWMDAKVADWVVTPRRGKAVEINALWYNALKLFEKWTGKSLEICEKCYESFNKKFWSEEAGYLYDVVEGEKGNDLSLRPNQLFSISLANPILENKYWNRVLDQVTQELLTPYGLRTLSPKHPDYKTTYDGDLRSRDAAYHQGTVWPWLIGPYVDAWMKVYPNNLEPIQNLLQSLEEHLNYSCIGTIAEIFDANPPYTSRGCFAQAWSVAEILRSFIKIKGHAKGTYLND